MSRPLNELDLTTTPNVDADELDDFAVRQLMAAVVKTAVDDIVRYVRHGTSRDNYVDAVLFLRRERLYLVYDQTMKTVNRTLHTQITNRINKGWSRYRVKKFIEKRIKKCQLIMTPEWEEELMGRLKGLR